MPKSFSIAFLLATVVAASFSTRADIIELKDGRTFNGSLVRDGDTLFITGEDGVRIRTRPDNLQKVTLTSYLTPGEAADAAWTRTLAEIRQASDLPAILDLHQKFLDKYPDQEISQSVRTSKE